MLDSLIASLKERFDQLCIKAYENLESLLLKSLSNESIANEFECVKCVYKGDPGVDRLQPRRKYFRKTLVPCEIAHYWKGSISIFKESFASIDKIFFLGED